MSIFNLKTPVPLSGFNIAEFKASALNNGVARQNKYLVKISPMSGLPWNLLFLSEVASIPEIDIESNEVQRYGYGPREYMPLRPIFGPLQINFITTSDASNILNATMNRLNYMTNFQGYKTLSDTNTNGASPYEVAYKGDYEFQIDIYVYTETQETVVQYTFNNCFVRTIGGIGLGWAQNDSYISCPVTFQYTDSTVKTSLYAEFVDGINSIMSIGTPQGVIGAIENFTGNFVPNGIANALNISNAATIARGALNIGSLL